MEDCLRDEWFENLLQNLNASEETAETDSEKLLIAAIVDAIKENVVFLDDTGNKVELFKDNI